MRLSQQVEVGLEAGRVREADLAQRAEAETRCNADQPAHRAQLFRRDEPDAAQCRKYEVPVAFDCLAGTAPISAAVGRQKLPVFPVETGISSIFPTQPSFGCKNGEANQVLASEFP
jgi:hypothetical protein